MAFFDTLKQSITGKQNTLTGPVFLRDECSAQAQVEKMEAFIKAAPPGIAKQIEQDIKTLSYGISGENAVAFELKHSYMPIFILRDLYLVYKGLTAQIDYVVIDSRFILVIECKKMTGDIEVTNTGDFVRLFKSSSGKVYKKEGIYSPIAQNERHLELIKHLLCDKMDSINERKCKSILHSIVVFANPKTILNMKYAKADIKKSIIRCDQLNAHMKNLHDVNKDSYWFPEDVMFKVAQILMAQHRENVVDYTQKYGLAAPISQTGEGKEEKTETIQTSLMPIEETPIYKELREYRLLKSREEDIKPYYIYNNAQLEEIIALMPETHGELMQIKGFAELKCNKYGDAILNIVKKYR